MSTFSKAFAAARKAKGAGATFVFEGKSYTTDRADDKPGAGKKTNTTATAPKTSARPRLNPALAGPKQKDDVSPKAPPKQKDDVSPKAAAVKKKAKPPASVGSRLKALFSGDSSKNPRAPKTKLQK